LIVEFSVGQVDREKDTQTGAQIDGGIGGSGTAKQAGRRQKPVEEGAE